MHHMNCHFKNNTHSYLVQVHLVQEEKGRPEAHIRPDISFKATCCAMTPESRNSKVRIDVYC